MSKIIKMCTDVRLPPWMRREAMEIAERENGDNTSTRGAVETAKKWKPGRTLRVRFLDGHPTVQAKVRDMAMEWTEYANLGFVFGNDPDAEIRISFTADDGSWSFLGTDNLSIPKSRPTMNFGWLTPSSSETEFSRVVKHEFGHALGMIHEHQHPTANIPWDKDATYEYYMSSQGWTKDEVDANLFQKYSTQSTQFSAYDKESIMHYPIDESLTIGDFSIGWNTKLSATDKTFIKTVYPGVAPKVTDLVVGAPATSASIGAFGEQDVYRFSVPKSGIYTIETTGSTDVIATLFGPTGKLIAEDDDSGAGRNARIVGTLSKGAHTVRIRHYSATSTGAYKILVKQSS
jgi:hypothetical protein